MRRRAERFALVLLLGAGACLSPTDPADEPIAAVRVTIGDGASREDTIQARATTRVHAAALASEGYELPVAGFGFASSDQSVAVVDELGTVRGVSPGEATITAVAPGGGPSGSVVVVVVPSTIAYTIDVGWGAGAMTFSTDFTRAYVATGSGSVVVVDALGFFRADEIALGADVDGLAATGSRLYATHADIDSVSVVGTARNDLEGRIWIGAGPVGAAATPARAVIAARWDRRVVLLEEGQPPLGVPVDGEPAALALSGDGTRLYATVRRDDGWHLVGIAPAWPDTLGSIRLAGEPTALATNGDGSRIYVLLGSARTVAVYVETGEGTYALDGTVETGDAPGGIGARRFGPAHVVVSGSPAIVFDGESLEVTDRIEGAGRGAVAVRPDGLFAFIADPDGGVIHVLGL